MTLPKPLSGRMVAINHPAVRAYDVMEDRLIYDLADATWTVDFAQEAERIAVSENWFLRSAGDGWIVAHMIEPSLYEKRVNVVVIVRDGTGIGHGIIFKPYCVTAGEARGLWPAECDKQIEEAFRAAMVLDEPSASDIAQADRYYAARAKGRVEAAGAEA